MSCKKPEVTRLSFYVYQPVAANAIFAPEPIRSASMSYMSFWMPQNVQFHDWGLGSVGRSRVGPTPSFITDFRITRQSSGGGRQLLAVRVSVRYNAGWSIRVCCPFARTGPMTASFIPTYK